MGMQITKIRRVLSFKQSTFLKEYIDKCTALRQQSTSTFAKNLWKLFANAVFGKFIECTRNYLDVTISFDAKKTAKVISNPCFSNMKILSDDAVLLFSKQPVVKLNKPIAVGYSILELSKAFMYEKYYDEIKPALGDCEVIMSDTDSFIIACYTQKKKNNLMKLKHMIDFSNYDPKDKNYSELNKNKLGYFKDELCGNRMLEFCGLRSKSYGYKVRRRLWKKRLETNFTSKCKGVTKAGQKQLRFSSYKACLQQIASCNITQCQIRSKNHCIQTVEVNKICFSSFDDKRYLRSCSIHSIGYGHKSIKAMKSTICPLCKICNPLK
jgi:hypothetical protein